MKLWQYVTSVLLALACLGVSVALVFVSMANQKDQKALQVQQARLNDGVLGQRGQQIASSIIQDMAGVSTKNAKIRKLLVKHGYNVPEPEPAAADDKAAAKPQPDKDKETKE